MYNFGLGEFGGIPGEAITVGFATCVFWGNLHLYIQIEIFRFNRYSFFNQLPEKNCGYDTRGEKSSKQPLFLFLVFFVRGAGPASRKTGEGMLESFRIASQSWSSSVADIEQ